MTPLHVENWPSCWNLTPGWNLIPCKLSAEINGTKRISNIELCMRTFVSLKRMKFNYCVTLFIFLCLMFTSYCLYLLKWGNGMTLIGLFLHKRQFNSNSENMVEEFYLFIIHRGSMGQYLTSKNDPVVINVDKCTMFTRGRWNSFVVLFLNSIEKNSKDRFSTLTDNQIIHMISNHFRVLLDIFRLHKTNIDSMFGLN